MGEFYYPDQFMPQDDSWVGIIGGAEAPGVLGVFMAVYGLIIFVAWAFSLVSYVLSSLGMYTIANRRGIRHAWLAWIPFGNLWILGSIADQYQYVAKGKIKNRRKILLGLNILLIVLEVGCFMGIIAMYIIPELILAILCIFIGLLTMVVTITILVYEYIAYYDLFSSSEPNNATLYLVLSIIFSVTLPFFVFACRKKDLGMPPRKQPAPQQVVVPAAEPVVETETEPVAEGFAQPEEFEEE